MPIEPPPDLFTATPALRRDGYAFCAAGAVRAALERETSLTDWATFAASWNALVPDHYLAASGRRRQRRHAVYSIGRHGDANREAHQPHYQSRTYNALQGGIERWFEPILPQQAGGCLQRVIRLGRDLFGTLAPTVEAWRVEAHQFRIEALADAAGEPTPEGVHRDGVDYVLVMMVDRLNIDAGTTTIHGLDGALLGSFTLTRPFDVALVDDHRVFHGVTPVTPHDPTQPAHRDVLVVTYRHVEPGSNGISG
ncbi:MAG TPA: 2OG-Fe dioxygenase family protein [Rhodanobacteraceae bacterium]|nr:2OG-Fe dioxygenase family protein [Rhodanobacteraceae bacterium]